jgi:hypothetical protein
MLIQTPIQTIQTNAIVKHKLFLVATDSEIQQHFPEIAEACLEAIADFEKDSATAYELLEEKLTSNFSHHDKSKLKRTGN